MALFGCEVKCEGSCCETVLTSSSVLVAVGGMDVFLDRYARKPAQTTINKLLTPECRETEFY